MAVDTTIYSGKICRGVIIDTFEYADFGDTFAEINAFLANDWAETVGPLNESVVPDALGAGLIGRGMKTLKLAAVVNTETITRTLPAHTPLQQGQSNARYLVVRVAKAPGDSSDMSIRPIIIDDSVTPKYCAANNPQALTDAMAVYIWKIGSTTAGDTDFDFDIDENNQSEPGSAGIHTDYDEWSSSDQIEKIALRFEISAGSADVYIDEIFIIDIDDDQVTEFHYDSYDINADFDYDSFNIKGRHGSFVDPRNSENAEITISGLSLDNEMALQGLFFRIRSMFAKLKSIRDGTNSEWGIFVYLDDEIYPISPIGTSKGFNRLQPQVANQQISFEENTDRVVLD